MIILVGDVKRNDPPWITINFPDLSGKYSLLFNNVYDPLFCPGTDFVIETLSLENFTFSNPFLDIIMKKE